MSTKIVFFGTEAWGVPTLEALVAAGQPVTGVITKPDAPAGRKRVLTPTPVKVAAQRLGLKVYEPTTTAELAPLITELNPTLGVLIAYGKIVPQTVLDLIPYGILNLHPSALPKFRGPSPIETAILEGAPLGFISIIRLTAAMDAGPILAQERCSLPGETTMAAPEAYAEVGKLAPTLMLATVADVLAGTTSARTQNEDEATTSRIITKADAPLDTNKSAIELARQIRAYAGWPGSELTINGQRLIITQAHAGDTEPLASAAATGAAPGTPFVTINGELAVTTGHGELIIDQLIVPGKPVMSGAAYLAGRPLTSR